MPKTGNSLLAAAFIALPWTGPAAALDSVFETEQATIRAEAIAGPLEHPWGMAFLPGGSALVTERPGRLRLLSPDGTLSEPLAGVPRVDPSGQGGLLDVALHPDFDDNRLVYLSFAEPGPEGTNSTAVSRGRLNADATALEDVEVIFSQQPKLRGNKHYGSRLVFDEDGYLFVTLGERSERRYRGQAQDLDSHLGKVVRIFPDGGVPDDNPFVGQANALPEIWSLGHRNIQAAAINPATGALWEIEHGPLGGDELNIAEPGENYGWPEVSFGVNYNGSPVGTGKATAPGFADPIYQWTPVIAPSGMLFYAGEAFPAWQGDLFVGGLRSRALVRLELNGDTVVDEERLLEEAGHRIRDVETGPDGALYLLVDSPRGEVLRISPAD